MKIRQLSSSKLMMIYYMTIGILLFILQPQIIYSFELSSIFSFRTTDNNNDQEEIELKQSRDIIADLGEEEYKRKLYEALGLTKKTDDTIPENTYGVDISFPIHHSTVSTNYPSLPHNQLIKEEDEEEEDDDGHPSEYDGMPMQPLGDKQSFYNKMIAECAKFYGNDIGQRCYKNERDRIDMNLHQPKSMQNYTDIGFKKIRAPEKVYTMIKQFWDQNNKNFQSPESWPAGNTYTNHWESPTYMLSIENDFLPGGGFELKQRIWDAARETIQDWIGSDDEILTPCSLYGIRIYKEGAVLATHVDRLPLVSSAIINVAQDVDEPWPIEVYGHDGKAYNITMEPGDMLLYESHSILHGRPFPLVGRYYANVFIHFEPSGHSLRHEAQKKKNGDNAQEFYKQAMKDAQGKKKDGDTTTIELDLPPYIVQGSPEEKRWRQENGGKRSKVPETTTSFKTGSTIAHTAASNGNAEIIKRIASSTEKMDLHAKDINGWQPLHEAARGGHVDVVKVLVENGVDINARTNNGKGGTALWWAETTHGANHPVSKFLRNLGAINIGPDL